MSASSQNTSKIAYFCASLSYIKVISEEIQREVGACLDVLNKGGTIVYPTDTIWGIGCDATNQNAVSRIYSIKKRMGSKNMIVLIDDASKLSLYVKKIPLITSDLLSNMNTPLTIIFPGGRNLAPNLLGADGSIAIRIVDHEFCRELIREFGRPVVSTSANLSGQPNPHSFQDINPVITSMVDYTVGLFHESTSSGKPSRIIRLYENGEFNVIRP